MKSQSISINLSNAALDARRQLPSYWLTLEQIDGDDRISRNEVAELVDKLYEIEPCEQVKEANEYGAVTSDPRTPVYVTNLDLMVAAKSTIDIAECERRRDGTYRASIRVCRSHEEIPYDLKVSYGRIIGKTVHKEAISVVVDVEEAVSTVLKRPVSGKLPIDGLPDPDEMRAEWLGPVYGRSGVLDEPPAISYGLYELQKDGSTKHVDKNLLHWTTTITGSLLVEYETWYEIVEVEITGIPSSDPYAFGTARKASVVAFYHSQPYDLELNPPTEDERADRSTLRSLCLAGDPLVEGEGRGLGEVTETEDDQPEPEQPYPEREYGCESVSTNLGDPEQYLEKCCVDGTPKRGNCGLVSSRRPADKKLSQETIDRMTGEWDGPIEFIGVGPCAGVQGFGDEGCGTLYTHVRILQRSCCEDVTPLAWNMNVTPDVLPHNSSIIIAWEGSDGRETIVRTTSNATWFDDGRKTAIGHGNSIELSAGPTFCGATTVTVSDGCTEAAITIRSDLGSWQYVDNTCAFDGVIASHSGGVGEAIIGKYKQVEQLFRHYWSGPSAYCTGEEMLDGSAANCLNPPCVPQYLALVESYRPSGAAVSTCMAYDMAAVQAHLMIAPPWGYLSDGAVVADSSVYVNSFGPCRTSAGWISGANRQKMGFYAYTQTLALYEWVC